MCVCVCVLARARMCVCVCVLGGEVYHVTALAVDQMLMVLCLGGELNVYGFMSE